MSKYINVDEIKRKYPKQLDADMGVWGDERTLREILDDEPAADVVEVVRCKDCKWYDGTPYCIETDFDQCEPDAYCSKGKRK